MAEMLNNNATMEQLPTAEETNLRQNEDIVPINVESDAPDAVKAEEESSAASDVARMDIDDVEGELDEEDLFDENGEEEDDEDGDGEEGGDEAKTTAINNLAILREEMAVALIRKKVGENIILYGVPGCGKSHTIKHNFPAPEQCKKRVVFHQDYTYSDFVGQILPETDVATNTISYPFKPGPFTEILKQAHNNPSQMHYLIIEEINRGNAPAIFGDLFQLLDRDNNGVSEYGIFNSDMALYIYKDKNHEIKIPSNLTLLATMNTADQNVFTLDTAFKRRWRMCCIRNNVDNWSKNTKICGTNVKWKDFVKKINNLIVENNEGALSNEDKRLGVFFVKPIDLANMQLFAEKVLMYLWNDAFRYNRDKVFKSEAKTLEDLIDEFYQKGFAIFVDELKFDTTKKAENKVKITAPLSGVITSSGKSSSGTKMSVPDRLATMQAKDPALYKLYVDIHDEIKKRIPTLEVGDKYQDWYVIDFETNPRDHDRAYFAVFEFKSKYHQWYIYIVNSVQLNTHFAGLYETSPDRPLPYKIIVDSSANVDHIADVIEGSYETLKAAFKP